MAVGQFRKIWTGCSEPNENDKVSRCVIGLPVGVWEDAAADRKSALETSD